MGVASAVGAASLGIVMGWLVIYSLRRMEKITASTLTAITSILVGGGVFRFLEFDPSAAPFYPMGLVAGGALYIFTLPARMRYSSPAELGVIRSAEAGASIQSPAEEPAVPAAAGARESGSLVVSPPQELPTDSHKAPGLSL